MNISIVANVFQRTILAPLTSLLLWFQVRLPPFVEHVSVFRTFSLSVIGVIDNLSYVIFVPFIHVNHTNLFLLQGSSVITDVANFVTAAHVSSVVTVIVVVVSSLGAGAALKNFSLLHIRTKTSQLYPHDVIER